MQAADVLRLVSGVLQDLEPGTDKRWEWTGRDNERVGLLDFLNLAVSEVVMQRPDAAIVSQNIRLDSGAWQRVPQCAVTFIGLNYNIDEDGRAQGSPITAVAAESITAWVASGICGTCGTWRGVEYFAHDRMADPRRFLVYPPTPEEHEARVNASWSVIPAAVESPDDCLSLPDTYRAALVHHVVYSVLSGDNEASNMAKAQHHLSSFYQALGVKMNTDMTWPKAKNAGA